MNQSSWLAVRDLVSIHSSFVFSYMILLPKSLFRFQNFPTCMLYDVRRVEFALLIARNERDCFLLKRSVSTSSMSLFLVHQEKMRKTKHTIRKSTCMCSKIKGNSDKLYNTTTESIPIRHFYCSISSGAVTSNNQFTTRTLRCLKGWKIFFPLLIC